MLVGSTFNINGLHLTYGCPDLSAAYVSKIYFQNYLVTIHFWVHQLKWGLSLQSLPTESLAYTTFGCSTLSAAYVGLLHFQNQWFTLHLWVSSLKCSLGLLDLLTVSLS